MECPACHIPNAEGARFCAKCGALLPASQTQDSDPLIGTVVGGRYRILGILGEGGMGRVYNGEQQMGTSVRRVAVKTLLAQFAKDPQVVARFMRECGTVSELEHPNTIKVYDFGQTNSSELYIAMELLTGHSLEKALEAGPLPAERVERVLHQICGSLQEAHDKGIVHRDLKPANIYLTTRAGEEDYVKVLDFGIAKRDDKHSKHEQKLTQQGTVLGTPPYMSPEQFKGHELDARSDVYSLGVMTYEMLTGRLPFDADTPWAWATQHMTAQPFPFETIPMAAAVPPKMKAAVMRALSKDKERRQQSARDFYEEFSTSPTSRSSAVGIPRATSEITAGGTSVMGHGEGYGIADPGSVVQSSHGYSPQASFPTGSAQVFPAPEPHAKKGGAGAIIAVLAVIGVIGVVGTVVVFSGKTSDTKTADTKPTASASPASAPSGAAAAPPSHATPSSTPSASTTPSATTSSTATLVPAEPSSEPKRHGKEDPFKMGGKDKESHRVECEQALAAAAGGNVQIAVNHYNKCTGSQRQATYAAIESAAMRNVSSKGCHAMASSRAAASIGVTAPLEALKRKRCGGGGGF